MINNKLHGKLHSNECILVLFVKHCLFYWKQISKHQKEVKRYITKYDIAFKQRPYKIY